MGWSPRPPAAQPTMADAMGAVSSLQAELEAMRRELASMRAGRSSDSNAAMR